MSVNVFKKISGNKIALRNRTVLYDSHDMTTGKWQLICQM